MARNSRSSPPVSAVLSPDQMRNGITRLENRLKEIVFLKPEALTEEDGDNVLQSLEDKANATLGDIFGYDTVEYSRFSINNLRSYTMAITDEYDGGIRARMQDIKASVSAAISTLQTVIDLFKEKLGDDGSVVNTVMRAYQGLELHPEIARACSKLYMDGHYANAVEAAVKALNKLVQLRSGLELDGTTLMERAFSPNSPKLKFNALSSQSDRDKRGRTLESICLPRFQPQAKNCRYLVMRNCLLSDSYPKKKSVSNVSRARRNLQKDDGPHPEKVA